MKMQQSSATQRIIVTLLLLLITISSVTYSYQQRQVVNVADKLWELNSSLVMKIMNSPFIQQLQDGTLSNKVFDYYINQDILYCDDYTRSISVAAAKTKTNYEYNVFHNMTDIVLDEHSTSMKKRYIVSSSATTQKKNDVNVKYSNLISATAWREHPYLAAVVLSPCMRLYAYIAQQICLHHDIVPSHPYYDWISEYNSTSYRQTTESLNKLLNWYANPTPKTEQIYFDEELSVNLYSTAMMYEYEFFNAAFDLNKK
jgi:thiaminase/transcriptional activator TenA